MAMETIDIVPESIEGEPINTRRRCAEFWGPPTSRQGCGLDTRRKVILLRVRGTMGRAETGLHHIQI